MKLLILNGPNLNLLAYREQEHYGSLSYEQLNTYILNHQVNHDNEITIKQSNSEGEILNIIHQLLESEIQGLIINPAAYSHYSIAILDALLILDIPIIEVHLSDVKNREEFRQKLITAHAAKELISGFGAESYIMAIEHMNKYIKSS